MRTRPLIQPVQTLEDYHYERLGMMPQHDVLQSIESVGRQAAGSLFRFTDATAPWWRANVGASGNATYNMRQSTPSSDAAWAMVDLALPMPMAGAIAGGFMWASAPCTAGAAALEAQIVDAAGTRNVSIPGCVISTQPGDTQAVSAFLFESTIRFSRTATVKPRITTTGGYAPTTADFGAVLLFELD